MLTAARFPPGEKVKFEIRKPNGRAFSGPTHDVAPDGTVSAKYETTSDPPGDYSVKATGEKGTTAEATFQLTQPTTADGGPSTSVGSSTTASGSRTAVTGHR
jgi:hypothetical protein